MSTIDPRPVSGPIGPPLDLPGHLYGVRAWWVSEEADELIQLRGYGNRAWLPAGGTTEAHCLADGASVHPSAVAPVGDCTCGLYAVHPWAVVSHLPGPAAIRRGGRIAGIVAAWGTIHVHREGFRAQFARPVVLLLPAGSDRRYRELVRRAAEQHQADVVAVYDARDVSSYCASRHLGLSRQTVHQLLTSPVPQEAVEQAGVTADRPKTRLSRGRRFLAAMGALLWGVAVVIWEDVIWEIFRPLAIVTFFYAVYKGVLAVLVAIIEALD